MPSKPLSHARHNVVAYIALFVALGGTAVAAKPMITGADVQDGSLTDADIAAANKDGTAGTFSLRTLGTGAQQAAAGDDARLSDARTPTGAAGGDLTGTYPNPSIAGDAVNSGKVANDSLTGNDIDESTLSDGLDGYERVTTPLAESNVTGSSVVIKNAEISCPTGKKILSGGYSRSLGPSDPLVDAISDFALDEDTWRLEFRLDPGEQINGTMIATCATP